MTIHPTFTQAQHLMIPLDTKSSLQHDETRALVEGCQRGERQAQMKVYQKYYNQVFAVCLRYSNDRGEAKSLVNAAFLKTYQGMGTYNYSGSFGGWVSRIAINTCIDEVRKRNKTLQNTVTMDAVPDVAVPNTIIDAMAAEDILAAIQQVSPMSRTVFCLYIIDGFKHAEIADMLNMKEVTSRWHLNNAKKELQVLLKNYNHQ